MDNILKNKNVNNNVMAPTNFRFMILTIRKITNRHFEKLFARQLGQQLFFFIFSIKRIIFKCLQQ